MAVIPVSLFTAKSTPISPPITPLIPLDVLCGAQFNGTPAPARKEQLSIAHVDERGLLSPWSDPVLIAHVPGGGYAFRPTDVVPPNPEIVAFLLRLDDRIGMVRVEGVGPQQFTPALPWCYPVCPQLLTDIAKTPEAAPPGGTSAVLTDKPDPLKPAAFSILNVDLEVAWCWLTESGETTFSPVTLSHARPDLPPSGVTWRTFSLGSVPVPPGATGYCVYLRVPGQRWLRGGTFPIDCMLPAVYQWEDVRPDPVRQATSTLSPLQQALSARQPFDVVLIDAEVVTNVPIIDQWGAEHTIITAPYGGGWAINYTGTGEVALLCQSSYTRWEGMVISGGVKATSNYSGGQAFGGEYSRCDFRGGIRTRKDSTWIKGQHVESESLYDNCHFSGRVPIELAGDQCANIRFRRSHVFATGTDRNSAALWIDSNCPVVFSDGLYVDGGFCLAYLGMRSTVRADDVFVDAGWGQWVLGTGYYPVSATIRGGHLNTPPINGKAPFLAVCSRDASVNVTADTQVQGRADWRRVVQGASVIPQPNPNPPVVPFGP